MQILRVNMENQETVLENLPEKWKHLGASALIAKIMTNEVSPDCDPMGPDNPLIIASGPLAGTLAPQLGRVSVGAKSPLTLGIKEANSGGPAAQMMDKLNIRAIVIRGCQKNGSLYRLHVSKAGIKLFSADEFCNTGNYELVEKLKEIYGAKISVISTGIAGERGYRGASVSFTDKLGDPSRNAARGGLGAVMGAKGLKAVTIDDTGAEKIAYHDAKAFRQAVKCWVKVLKHDVGCSLFSRLGTPFAVANSAGHGTLPARNYRSGRPEDFIEVSGERIQEILFERGGKMHGCMPGCVVKCSIIYPGPDGKRICGAYEYETIGLLGTNLGIVDNDAIARLKFMCDDLGLDAIDTGAALGLAAEAGKMQMGDPESAEVLLQQVRDRTDLGEAIGNGVVQTASYLCIDRVPAWKGQAFPAHDPRSVKGTGVTYLSSPMGADHTAGLTYRQPWEKKNQAYYSLRTQIQSAACDAFGYCINAVPGGKSSIYDFLAQLMNARFGTAMSAEDVMTVAKQTLRDQLTFNEKSGFSGRDTGSGSYIRNEPIEPTGQIFDVAEADVENIWKGLEGFSEKEKVWEVRTLPMPEVLAGAGAVKNIGSRLAKMKIKKPLLAADPFMEKSGRVEEICGILKAAGISPLVFAEVEPDPPIELIERAGGIYKQEGCDAVIGLGGGSALDTAKCIGLRVSHDGDLREYESILGGGAKIFPVFPPVICIPTTSGTGSEANPAAMITDKKRNAKVVIMSNHLIPKMAVIDPVLSKSMPPALTVQSGIDALAHSCEGYVSLATDYNPYLESKALYAVKLIGKSLAEAYRNPENLEARMDMSMAAMFGGISIVRGLCCGHALAHVLGGKYHMPHGKAVVYGLMLFVRANQEVCREPFSDLARMLGSSDDLAEALASLYDKLDIRLSLKEDGIEHGQLARMAFLTSRDAVNMATDPTSPNVKKIQELLEEMY